MVGKTLKRVGGQLVLVRVRNDYVYESFALAGLTHIIPVFETVDEARAGLS